MALNDPLIVDVNGKIAERAIALFQSDLGLGRIFQQVILGSATPATPVNQSVTIPLWAKTYRFRGQAAGGGGGSGSATTATTLASSGGSGGSGGNYFDLQGDIASLPAGGTTINVSIGSVGVGGAGVTGIATLVNGNAGTNGGDLTLTKNATVFARASGGALGRAGSGSSNSNPDTRSTTSGNWGGLGGTSGTNTGATNGGQSPTNDAAAAGGGGAGYSTANATGTAGTGAKGSTGLRDASEAVTAIATNAAEISVNNFPTPGNGGGGGNPTQAGGNGAFGGGGGGGGASRTNSLAGGNGGRGYCIIEFFGTEPVLRYEKTRTPASTRNLILSDAGTNIVHDGAGTITMTMPSNVFNAINEIEFSAIGTGDIIIVPGAGTTLNGDTVQIAVRAGQVTTLKFYSPTAAYLAPDPRINQIIFTGELLAGVNQTGQTFATIPLNNILDNYDNKWDAVNFNYPLPWKGDYDLTVKLRLNDFGIGNAAAQGTSYYLNAGTSNIDNASGIWQQTNNSRNGAYVSIKSPFQKNDPIRMYAYIDQTGQRAVNAARMVITYLGV